MAYCCLICFCKIWTCYQMSDHELRGWGERKERQMTCIILCQKLQHHPCQIEIKPLNRRRFAKPEWQYCTCPKFARKIPNKFLNLAKESSLGVKNTIFGRQFNLTFLSVKEARGYCFGGGIPPSWNKLMATRVL